jgi:hypothetical protein
VLPVLHCYHFSSSHLQLSSVVVAVVRMRVSTSAVLVVGSAVSSSRAELVQASAAHCSSNDTTSSCKLKEKHSCLVVTSAVDAETQRAVCQ